LEATLLLARALLALPGTHREAHELATAVLPQAQASCMSWARADALLVAALALAVDPSAPHHQRDAARLAAEAERRTCGRPGTMPAHKLLIASFRMWIAEFSTLGDDARREEACALLYLLAQVA
jgi:hypothetical protein